VTQKKGRLPLGLKEKGGANPKVPREMGKGEERGVNSGRKNPPRGFRSKTRSSLTKKGKYSLVPATT